MEESWNELWSFEDVEAVKAAASKTLGNCGVSLPRRGSDKISSTSSSRSPQASFGVPLTYGQQPTVIYKYGDNGRFKVPRFLAEASQFLEENSSFQGIFRKAGSVSRQKALKAVLDSGSPSISPDSNVHDVASLFKQYFRELPEPLIMSHLLPVFEACYSLPSPSDRQRCVLLACLLLPQAHLECLCVLMKLLHHVSESSSENLMDASNLAIVIAPNIIRPNINYITPALGNPLKNQAGIVQLLIESAPLIGCVPSNVYAVKKAAKAEEVARPQNHKIAEQVCKKSEVPVSVSNHETGNGHERNVAGSIGGYTVQKAVDNNVVKGQGRSDDELNFQKVSSENVHNVSNNEEKVKESVPKVHTGNGVLKERQLPDEGVKSESAADGVLKSQRRHKMENSHENGPQIKNLQNSELTRVQIHRGKGEEKGVEPVGCAAAALGAMKALNEVEHPRNSVSEGKELMIASTSWTGSLYLVGLIGLSVLIVALIFPYVIHVIW